MIDYIYSLFSGQPQRITELLQELDDLKKKNLWHELSKKLLELVQDPEFNGEQFANNIHDWYIKDMESKMSPLILLEVLYYLGQHFESSQFLEMLKTIEGKVQDCDEHLVLCKTLQGMVLFERMGDTTEAKKIICEVENIMDNTDQNIGIEIKARFYKLVSTLSEKNSDVANYYKFTMKYLACIDIDSLSEEEQLKMSKYLLTAALITPNFFDLRKLELHPVMNALKADTPWLLELLHAIADGDLQTLDKLENKYKTIPEFQVSENLLKEKTRLLSIVHMADSNRILTFDEICKKVCVSLNDVEHLLMKTMASGLIHGKIDQVLGQIHIIWRQPQVLNKEEMEQMIYKVEKLMSNVEDAQNILKHCVSDIIDH